MSCLVVGVITVVVGPGLWLLADRLATGNALVDGSLHLLAVGLWIVCVGRLALWVDRERDLRDRGRAGSDLDQP